MQAIYGVHIRCLKCVVCMIEIDFLRLDKKELSCYSAELFYIHEGRIGYSSAYERNEEGCIAVKVSSNIAVDRIYAVIFECDQNEPREKIVGELIKNELGADYFIFKIPFEKINVGIYYFYIEILSFFDIIYMAKGENGVFLTKSLPDLRFQLSISEFSYEKHSEYSGGIIYHVFVDRFFRKNTGPITEPARLIYEWDSPIDEYPVYQGAPIDNRYFYGGTLWVSPIFVLQKI